MNLYLTFQTFLFCFYNFGSFLERPGVSEQNCSWMEFQTRGSSRHPGQEGGSIPQHPGKLVDSGVCLGVPVRKSLSYGALLIVGAHKSVSQWTD